MAMFDVVKTVDGRPRDLRNILEKRLMLIILEILIRKVYLPGTLSPKFKNSLNQLVVANRNRYDLCISY